MKFFKTRKPDHLNKASRVVIATIIMQHLKSLQAMTEPSSSRMVHLKAAWGSIKAYRKEANKD